MGSINFKAPVVIARFGKVRISFLFLIYRKPKLLACSLHFPMTNQNKIFNPPKSNSYRKIQQDATVYQNLLFRIYKKLNMFWATDRPSSGA
jgi:hypothetical protein